MGKTTIEWCDESVNPIRARLGDHVGHHCEKVSPGCKNCYASKLQPRFRMPPYEAGKRVGVEHFLDASKLREVLTRKKPTRYFWCDMTDMFGDWVPNEWIASCFAAMAATPWHTHMVLTKRPERMRAWFFWVAALGLGLDGKAAARGAKMFGEREYPWPLPNVEIGVSVENQASADERIPLLLQCPAAKWFVSAEPLLGNVDFARIGNALFNREAAVRSAMRGPSALNREQAEAVIAHPQLNWVIVGGESGPHARPCHVEWIRSIVEQCREAGTACFVKQLGALAVYDTGREFSDHTHWCNKAPTWLVRGEHFCFDNVGRRCEIGSDFARARDEGAFPVHIMRRVALKNRKGGDPSEWPEDLRVREFPEPPHA